TSTATVDAVFAEARRLGASIVQVNHPLIPYGYFTSVAGGVAPGGFNPHFDLIEINATESATDAAVYEHAWQFWNAGQRYYLGAGTDTHDVWNRESGRLRAYAHVDGALTTDAYVTALRAGRAYVSYGPLIYPAVMFGSTLRVRTDDDFTLGFELESLAGLRRAELIGGGATIAQQSYDGAPRHARADFAVHGAHARWYALIVEDAEGNKAYTNPVWIEPMAAAE
ncbi:MAG: CehA/McbA family metallohydrolase, partial [Proteobacteria bacterium]|nr:CehA/McbA family metallohydrolase [Pseudomonadota bacterium]